MDTDIHVMVPVAWNQLLGIIHTFHFSPSIITLFSSYINYEENLQQIWKTTEPSLCDAEKIITQNQTYVVIK